MLIQTWHGNTWPKHRALSTGLDRVMRARGMSSLELSAATNISTMDLALYLTGMKVAGNARCRRMADALGVSVFEMLCMDPPAGVRITDAADGERCNVAVDLVVPSATASALKVQLLGDVRVDADTLDGYSELPTLARGKVKMVFNATLEVGTARAFFQRLIDDGVLVG